MIDPDANEALETKLAIAEAAEEFCLQRVSQLESLLREAEKFCPRSRTGEGEKLGDRIEKALTKEADHAG